MIDWVQRIDEAKAYIQQHYLEIPLFGLVLGSGLGELADEMVDAVRIPFGHIPHFPVSTVEGHAGQLVLGRLEGKAVLAMQGRFHYYEGYAMQDVVFPVRVMKALGIDNIIVTNACGGMNPNFEAGQLMLITDHLNLTGANPLIGPNLDEFGPRFPDMSRAYTPAWIALAERVAADNQIIVHKGVYAGISGPYYLPPAELRMLRTLGGDAVGMSTVGEVIAASHMQMNVLGVSCITDMAIADSLEPISHEQVMAMANEAKPKFKQFIKAFIAAT
jgi:purine-nucleoside phosphorylase